MTLCLSWIDKAWESLQFLPDPGHILPNVKAVGTDRIPGLREIWTIADHILITFLAIYYTYSPKKYIRNSNCYWNDFVFRVYTYAHRFTGKRTFEIQNAIS